jgi:hypothetical protein
MGVMILQPAVGWMLDRYWTGAAENGVRIYDSPAWQAGFTLVFVWLLVSLICIALTRETHCKQLAG